jgi:hypothetical protein
VTRTLGIASLGIAAGLAAGVLLACAEPGGSCAARPKWPEGARRGGVELAYAGYGPASACRHGGGWTWRLSPAGATASDETHAALALGPSRHGDARVLVRVRTRRQLRQPRPRPWEVAWVVWHYTDDRHFYYLALKPNGWELGKEDPAYPGAQRFLATGSTPRYPVGPWHDVEVRQTGDTISVRVDGQPLTTARDRQAPYRGGRAGFYTEDADVEATRLIVR